MFIEALFIIDKTWKQPWRLWWTEKQTEVHLDDRISCNARKKWAAAAAELLQSCPTLCNPIDGSPPGSCPWDSPGKNTGVGCHFLLQCMKVKSESEVDQLCRTLSGPMDCSPPGPSVHGIFQARVLEWGAKEMSYQDTKRHRRHLNVCY